MKNYIFILLAFIYGLSAAAQSEDNTAKSFIIALKHKSFYHLEFFLSEKADKKVLETKFNTLLSNASKSGINVEKLQYDFHTSEWIEGTKHLVLVIVYKLEDGSNWDDLILLVSKERYDILDIGRPEKALKKDATLHGKNYKKPADLSSLFYPNLPKREDALNAARNILTIVNSGKAEDLIPFIAYTGSDDPARKHLSQPLNPKNEKDKMVAKSIYNKLSGLFPSPENIYAEGFKSYPESNTCNFRAVCKSTKNTESFAFVVINGKYLLY